MANMSPEERELERQAILERFGPGVEAILQRAKRNRQGEREGAGFEREIDQVPGSPGKYLLITLIHDSSWTPSRATH